MVREFGVDAVHIDASWPNQPQLTPPIDLLIRGLQEELPNTVLASESVLSFEELGVWAFSQGAVQGLVDPRLRPKEQGSLALESGHDILYGWMDQPSDVCAFVKDYFYPYPHLVAANSFVPVGKIANLYPERKIPLSSAEQFKVMRDARRLGYLPGLRVNYRKYGLDPETRQIIQELF
jgi:hypothetical protein